MEDALNGETSLKAEETLGSKIVTTPQEDPSELIESSKCHTLFENLVDSYYIPLETWYLRTIIEKSHRLAKLDTSAHPPQNTTPDDVFYILKAILSRVGSG